MRIFDTLTQELKYKVLKEVARLAYAGNLSDSYYAIPRLIVPEDKDPMRCCIYKDRAIVEEMVRQIIGEPKNPAAILDVLDIACDECPIDRYNVSEGCRGCISHKCIESCPTGAIHIGPNRKAVIDKDKCIECGKCFKACPYSAIREQIRPCVKSCKINAIKVDKNRKAVIDHEKCVSCGACMTKCPFGAIQDRAYILEVIDMLQHAEDKDGKRVYAMVAPSIGSQYKYASIEQIVAAMKVLGFASVSEVAVGADITAYKDAVEFSEKGALMSSCCPSFVQYVRKNFPKLADFISENPSPMVECAKLIKQKDPGSKVVFIGPCTSKKFECRQPKVHEFVDSVLTFEELQALIDSRDIIVEDLEPCEMISASYFGRVFARAGGVSEAVRNVIKEENLDIEPNIIQADGLDNIKVNMLKHSKTLLPKGTFIEGMACTSGCINGAGCVNHDARNVKEINTYSEQASQEIMIPSVKKNLGIEE